MLLGTTRGEEALTQLPVILKSFSPSHYIHILELFHRASPRFSTPDELGGPGLICSHLLAFWVRVVSMDVAVFFATLHPPYLVVGGIPDWEAHLHP